MFDRQLLSSLNPVNLKSEPSFPFYYRLFPDVFILSHSVQDASYLLNHFKLQAALLTELNSAWASPGTLDVNKPAGLCVHVSCFGRV